VHRAEHTVDIGRPPSEVFSYLVKPDLMQAWIGGLVAFTPLDDGPALGARSRQTVQQGGRTFDVESEIVELIPDERLAARATASSLTTLLTYALEPIPAGTRVQATIETELQGLAGRLLGGIAGAAAERKLAADLDRLARLLAA